MQKKPISYHYFLCEISLKKKNWIGIVTSEIIIVISSDYKIIILKFLNNKDSKNFPFNKSEKMDFEVFKKWVIDNNYSMSFFTKSKNLKLVITYHFEDIKTKKSVKNPFFNRFKIFNKLKLFIK